MVDKIKIIIEPFGIVINFDTDWFFVDKILTISKYFQSMLDFEIRIAFCTNIKVHATQFHDFVIKI